MDIHKYESALRKKIRFDSPRGQLSLEQLWDVPLRSRNDFNLDNLARTASRNLKDVSEESFVNTSHDPKQTAAVLRFDLVKHVIAVKLREEEAAKKRAGNIKEREKLLGALEKKQDDKLGSMSEAQIKRRLAELSE